MNQLTQLPNWVFDFFEFNEDIPINRLAFTKEDMIYKVKVMKKMLELGMSLTVDSVGNICGTLMGENPEKTKVVFCSHTDSVPDGGQYDGCVGVVMPLVAIERQKQLGMVFDETVKVIICACEESSRFNVACLGSKYLNGMLPDEKFEALKDKEGVTLKEAVASSVEYLHALDMTEFEMVDGVILEDECHYGIEIHIEQYESLVEAQMEIGIVNSIVSPYRFETQVTGVTGHTGTAPMALRKDAVVAAAKFVGVLNDWAMSENSNVRIAVPKFETAKGWSMNKIADVVNLATDVRMQYPNSIETTDKRLKEMISAIEAQTNTTLSTHLLSAENPVKTDDELSNLLADLASNENGLKTMIMPSWAGHDMAFLPVKKRSLIFIPSTHGSHNPQEHTQETDVLNGVNVIISALSKLA